MMPPADRIRVPAEVAALIRNLHPEIKRKIRSALDEILNEPSCGKELRDELAGYRSLRLGRIRIVYRQRGEIIEVVAIGPRDVIYYETALRLRRLKN